MKFKDLAADISKREGKKHQASHGDVLEILRLVSILIARDPSSLVALLNNGVRHGKKTVK